MREPVATSRLSEVEVASALARLTRAGALSAADRDLALARLADDMERVWVVETTRDVTGMARGLPGAVLRAGDAVQLASCLFLRRELAADVPMVAYDDRLRQAAAACGVPVIPRKISSPRRG
jgi:hypothetical protein